MSTDSLGAAPANGDSPPSTGGERRPRRSTHSRLRSVDLEQADVDLAVARRLPEAVARRLQAVLLEDLGDSCVVGMVRPQDLRALDELSMTLRRPVDVVQVAADPWADTLDRIYGKTEQIDAYAREVLRNVERDDGVVDLGALGGLGEDGDAPVVRLLQTVFEHAAQTRASDIHLEPQEDSLRVRFRIDGALHVELQADPKIAAALCVRLKLIAGLDISERRLPQDGRFAVRSGRHALDVRMSTLPTLYGESIVLRVLRQRQALLGLADSGMPPHVLEVFERVIRAPHGIVLVTGPTGSGKTTTLYGALQQLNHPDVKILTCEDPVEYRLQGLNQVQVNEKIGLSFSRVLRSFLRQDPDILFVGEIRDQETAQIATRAAMTGHLVLSTLHTNDATSTPQRLIDMGVPGYMVASTLRCVVSQRLVRLVCPYCSTAHQPDPQELAWLHTLAGARLDHTKLRHGAGCVRCSQTGYSGRAGVFEIMEMTPALAAPLHVNDDLRFRSAAAQEMGGRTLAHHVLRRVQAGETTLAEAMKTLTSVEA